MAKIEAEEERLRLARWYGGMDEEELTEIARREGALTDLAREVIRAELLRRGLKVEQEGLTESPAGDSEMSRVKIRDYTFVLDALLAKSILDSAGIECLLSDESTIWVNWAWSNALGGVKLWVREEDVATAKELLKEEASGDTPVEE